MWCVQVFYDILVVCCFGMFKVFLGMLFILSYIWVCLYVNGYVRVIIWCFVCFWMLCSLLYVLAHHLLVHFSKTTLFKPMLCFNPWFHFSSLAPGHHHTAQHSIIIQPWALGQLITTWWPTYRVLKTQSSVSYFHSTGLLGVLECKSQCSHKHESNINNNIMIALGLLFLRHTLR